MTLIRLWCLPEKLDHEKATNVKLGNYVPCKLGQGENVNKV